MIRKTAKQISIDSDKIVSMSVVILSSVAVLVSWSSRVAVTLWSSARGIAPFVCSIVSSNSNELVIFGHCESYYPIPLSSPDDSPSRIVSLSAKMSAQGSKGRRKKTSLISFACGPWRSHLFFLVRGGGSTRSVIH